MLGSLTHCKDDEGLHNGHGVHPDIEPRPAVFPVWQRAKASPAFIFIRDKRQKTEAEEGKGC
jgi:hypothetical protein